MTTNELLEAKDKIIQEQAEKLQQQDAINEALIAEIKQLKAEMAEMKSAKK